MHLYTTEFSHGVVEYEWISVNTYTDQHFEKSCPTIHVYYSNIVVLNREMAKRFLNDVFNAARHGVILKECSVVD